MHRFAGISLAGGKTDKTCVAVMEYFPEHEKVFLSRLYEKIGREGEFSSDHMLHQVLMKTEGPIDTIAFDVPLDLPKCISCRLACPGYEKCKVKEIQWMREKDQKNNLKKKPQKIFTPYTQRPVEMLITGDLEEKFSFSHALGANMAPLTARAHFLKKRLKAKMIEVYPKLSIWRIGRSLRVAKSHLRFHRHSVGGDEARQAILKALVNKDLAFIYQQDIRAMVSNHHAFEAFIAGMTAYLKFRGLTEKPPVGFPKGAGWVEFPAQDLQW